MQGWRLVMRDWRFWAFAGVVVVIAVADLVTPPDVVLMTFLVVPVIASAVVGSPRMTGTLTVLALVLAGVSAGENGYPIGDTWRRMVAMALIGAVSVVLAGVVGRAGARSREERRRYLLMAENSSDVVALGDNGGTLTWVSDSVTRLLGWTPRQLEGMAFVSLVHPDDLEVVKPAQELLLDGQEASFEVRVRRSDGVYRWVSIQLRPEFDSSGVVVARVGGWRDAEAEHAARAALMTSEERFRRLAEHATDAVFRTSPDGTIEWAAGNFEHIVGWTAKDIVGRRADDVVHPDHRDAVAAAHRQAVDGTPVTLRSRILTKSGQSRWVEMSLHASVEDGQPCVLGDWWDVEVEVRTQEALAASEARYRLLAENASDVVYAAGPNRKVTWVSPAVVDALGWSPDELLGTAMADLLHPEDRAVTEVARVHLYRGEAVDQPSGGFIVRMRTKDGQYRWMSNKVSVQFDTDGKPAGLVGGLSLIEDVVAARQRAEVGEARLQATLDSLLDPHVMLDAVRDGEGRIVDFVYTDASDAACAYNRRTRRELVGSRLLDLLPGHAGAGLLAMYANVVDTGEPLTLDNYRYPNEIQQGERFYDIRAVSVGDSLSYTWRDVTDRHEAVARISESEEQFRLLAENSSDVVVRSRDGLMRWVSPSLTTALGWDPTAWVGHTFEDFTHSDDVPATQAARAQVQDGETVVTTLRLRDAGGVHHWVEIHAGQFIDADGEPDGIVASFRVTDREVAAQEELQRRARYDDLTGVLKREEALARLRKIARHVRRGGHESAILFCDIDWFKDINDQYGHAAGDEVLRTFARRIEASVRAGDTVARMGGDEFLVVLDGIHHLDEAAAIAEKIRALATGPMEVPDGAVSATLSIGVTLSAPDEDADSMVERADRAMYDAKEAGRNRVITITAPAPLPTADS